MFKHILIPTDGSEVSRIAVEKGLAFARDAGAKVTVLTVIEPVHIFSVEPNQVTDTGIEYDRRARERITTILGEVRMKAVTMGVPCDVVTQESDHPYQIIIETATNKRCDLIAMGSHGRRGMVAMMLGSQTINVLTHSTLPVLVYR